MRAAHTSLTSRIRSATWDNGALSATAHLKPGEPSRASFDLTLCRHVLQAVPKAERILGEALNYLQHFGLLRVPGQPIEDRHTWNHLSAATRILGLEITNHVEHHQDPDRPFYALVPRQKGPQMRNILLWGIAAFFPPIWNRVIQPRLKDWDLNHANADERALAREANRRAGWPDWLGDVPQAAVAQAA